MIKTKGVGWVSQTVLMLTAQLGFHSGGQTNPVKPVIEDFVSFQNATWKKSITRQQVKIMNKTVKKKYEKQLMGGLKGGGGGEAGAILLDKSKGRGGLPALFVISIPAAPPSNIRLLFNTGKLAVLMSTPVRDKQTQELVNGNLAMWPRTDSKGKNHLFHCLEHSCDETSLTPKFTAA